jgi:hypothetical protein
LRVLRIREREVPMVRVKIGGGLRRGPIKKV